MSGNSYIFLKEKLEFMNWKNVKNISKLSYSVLGAVIIILSGAIFYYFLTFQNKYDGSSSEKVIYYADNISPAHLKVIDRFNELYRGKIRVVCINLPFTKFSTNERKELFARYLRGESDRIDIFSIDQIWITRFARWCEPVDKYFRAEEIREIIPNAIKPCYYGHRLICLPMFIDQSVMYCRMDLLQKLPLPKGFIEKLRSSITWEEFIETGRELRKYGYPVYIFQADNYEGLVCSFIELLLAQKDESGLNCEISLNSPEAHRALTTLADLVNVHRISPSVVTQLKENNSYSYFIANNGLFYRGWPNSGWDYKALADDSGKIKHLVRFPLPHFSGHRYVSLTGGWNLMISKYSRNKKEAAEFIRYCLGKEAQKLMYNNGGFLPVNRTLYNNKAFVEKNNELQFYKGLFDKGIYRPGNKYYTKWSDILSQYIKSAINKDLSVDKALAGAEERLKYEFSSN